MPVITEENETVRSILMLSVHRRLGLPSGPSQLLSKNSKLSLQQSVKAYSCISCEVRTSSTYKKGKAIPVTGRGKP
jgi:hypothetical protein